MFKVMVFAKVEWFRTSGSLYSLLFGVSKGSALIAVLCNGLLSRIVTCMESCLIGTHITSSHIYCETLLIMSALCKHVGARKWHNLRKN